jgi:Xaa-Pro aminopeptidase
MSGDRSDEARRQAGQRRMDAVRAQLEARGLELLLVCGSGRHHFIEANLGWWLSGVRQLGRDAIVALPRDGDPVLLTMPRWDAARARRRGWIDDVVAVDDVALALASVVAHRGWRGLRVGVAGRNVASAATASALSGAFATAPVDADDAVLAVAGVHDAWSLGSIAEAGYRHLCDVAEPGLPEYQLAAAADAHMRELGADDNFLLVSASQHNRAVHAPTERVLAAGDVILGEISPSVDGQFAQICRSAVLGEPDERQLRCYEILREAYAVGLAHAGPGVPVREVAAVMNELVAGYGYERYTKPPYMRTRGHAMGLAPLVPADISERSEVVLAPGMAFVLHPNQYFPDAGYFLCGEQVVIDEDGAHPLAPESATLDVLASAVVS